MNNIYRQLIFLLVINFSGNFNFCLASKSFDKQGFTIVIDAGHGGKDSGALGSFSQEKDIALKVALKLGSLLQYELSNLKIVYTRSDDTFIPLFDRAKIANENKADLFISLHANWSKNTNATGAETFVMGLHKTQDNLEVAQKENAVIVLEKDYSQKYEGYDPNSAESFIIFSLMQNAFLESSLLAADFVQHELFTQTQRINRGVKQAGFLVLWNTSMPSILIEVGFISNITEERYINSDEGIEKISKAICNAIKNYFVNFHKMNELLDNPKNEKPQTVTETKGKNEIVETKNDKTDKTEIKDNTVVNDIPQLTHDGIPKKGIFFTVQLTAAKSQPDLTKPEFKALPNVFCLTADGLNKCYSGVYSNYEQVKENVDMCKNYFPGAFIVAFEDSKVVPVNKAINKLKQQ